MIFEGQSDGLDSHVSVSRIIFDCYLGVNWFRCYTDVTTGTGYCLVGFNWIIDFFN